MSGLRRFLENPPPRLPKEQTERCELCDVEIPAAHGHVVNVESRSLLCTCRPCHLLFTRDGAAQGRFRAVPDRYVYDPEMAFSEDEWAELQIPVGVAFLFRNSATGRYTAFYPSPAGATESLLPIDSAVVAHPALADLQPDVEALLIRRDGARFECFLVPIDACYDLVGRVRLRWRGFDGGAEAREEIESFFDRLRERSGRP